MEKAEKLPVKKIFRDAFIDMRENSFSFVIFTVVNFLFMVAGFSIVGGSKEPMFLVLVLVYYAFWVYFFRFYFRQKPYFVIHDATLSLVPSVKILFFASAFVLLLIFLPFAPLFVGNMASEQQDEYLQLLQDYMLDNKLVDLILNVLFILASPVVFYRPFMAWISAILGYSGSIRKAMGKTRENYWRFVLVGILMNAPFILWSQLDFYLPVISDWAAYLPASILIVYFNIVIARIYKFFS